MVTHTSFHKPSKVDRSRDRLEAAVKRLETALSNNPRAGAGEADEAAISDQVAALTQTLETLEAENASLRNINSQVSDRLDSAIGRFKLVIGD